MNALLPKEWLLTLREEEIAEIVDSMEGFSGFCGTNCRLCGRTANVLDQYPWSCPCGGLNHGMTGLKVHEAPEFGPTAQTIQNGIHRSQRWKVWEELHYA